MSLSPPLLKKVKYIPKPSNPNLLVPEEEEDDEEEEQQLKEVDIPRDPKVIAFEEILYPQLFRALAPLYTFIGYLEAESGKRIYYRFDKALSLEQKQNPLVKGAVTIDEFKFKNAHLGPAILNLIHEERLKPVEKIESRAAQIGISVDQFRSLYRQLIDPNASELHFQIFPVQLWDILPTSTFQYIIEKSTYGAMDMSAKELQKDLKLLIISDKVNHKFAQFVAKKFISPKQNAFASGIQGGQMQYRIASGFQTTVMANTKWLLACRKWFEGVILVDNPALKDIEPRMNLLAAQMQDIYERILDAEEFDGFPQLFKSVNEDQFARIEQYLVLRQLPNIRNDLLRFKYEYDNLRLTM